MAISLKEAGAYIDLTTTGSVSIPGTPADGDRMFLFVSTKDYSATINVGAGWTAIGSQYADGTVTAGNGTGSISVQAWYRDWVSGDTSVSVTPTDSSDGGTAIVQVWTKDSSDEWDTPLATNAAWTANTAATPQTVSAVASLSVSDGAVVLAFAGWRDDIASVTRPTDGIDVSSGITWNGDHVESPATHYSSSSANDAAADLGHRFVTTGGTVTLRFTATLGTAETGAIKFVAQGVSPPITSEILRPIDGLEEYSANTTWQDIDDVVTQPTTPGSADYLEYAGTSETTYTEKWLVEPPTPGYVIQKATLWVLAKTVQSLPNMYIWSVRIKLNGTWYDLGVVSQNVPSVTVVWYSFEINGLSESTDSEDIGFELVIVSTGAHVDQKLQIDAAYLELEYPEQSQSSGFFLFI